MTSIEQAIEALELADLVSYSEINSATFAAAIAALRAQPDSQYDKTEMNAFVQALYEQKMQEGKHGHYETMYHVVHKAIARARPASLPRLNEAQIDRILGCLDPADGGHDEIERFLGDYLRAQPAPPPECQTEAEKTAYAFGWWKGIESVRMAQPATFSDELREVAKRAQPDHSELIAKLRNNALSSPSEKDELMLRAADALKGKP